MAEKAKGFEYYEAITVRDSSLSACSQAVMAAEVGQLDLAHDYLTEAALMDLRDLARNTRDGVHVASLAGTWIALVAGFGGLRDHGGHLTFAPRLPATLQRLRFVVRWRGAKVRVEITADQATYTVEDGPDLELELAHHGTAFTLTPDHPVIMGISPAEPLTPRPSQPAGRAPTKALSQE
jgi:alpha,alpha-trehalose phosphorylase